jgi:RNA 2',3'-cyclic 3'-phosphodiesterase
MRTFIAIPLPYSALKELSSLQNKLRKSGADIRWVKPYNMHITLKFLGNIDKKTTKLISDSIKNKIKTHNAFEISVEGAGAFPNINDPVVIWVGIDKGMSECTALQNNVETCTESTLIECDKKEFIPHITIGRVCSNKNKRNLIDAIKKEKDFSLKAKIRVKKITLFSSLLTQKGPVYSILEGFPLPEAC